jgi:co-chaperonin GroES (HSP10)
MTVDATQTVEESPPKTIPDRVNIFENREFPEPPVEVTPETVHNDELLVQKLPIPTGYRILILPFSQKTVTKGGIHLAESYVEKERLSTNVGFVVSLGPDAYKDDIKYPNGAWCKARDWVIFGRYAGARIKIDGGDLRLLNDDEVLAVIDNPEDVQ